MIRSPRIGETGEIPFRVAADHAITIAPGVPPVLSTPSLIWFLEHAAIEALRPVLETGEASVGVQVDVEHLAATPVGGQVVCTARVIHSEGREITFQIQASDDHERIARGIHKRRVVQLDRFVSYVGKKS